MREILFRGKGNPKYNDGSWHEGYLTHDTEDYQIYTPIGVRSYCTTTVLEETIGQYTGLTDRKGKKIFEGDIVKCSDEINEMSFLAAVEFGNPNGEYNWGWQLRYISGAMPNLDILLWVEMEESGIFIEVIGNIHDNPELLKGDNND